jgi:MFS family permease
MGVQTIDGACRVGGLLRRNVTVNLLDGGVWGLAFGFGSMTTMVPLFLSRLTDSALLIGLVPGMQLVAWQLPQLFMANHVARSRCFRPAVLRWTLNERLPFLGLALAALAVGALGRTTALVLVFALVLWQGLGSGLVANFWQNMIAKIIPPRRRGTFLGVQAALRSLMISAGAVAAGWILERTDDRFDFALCFLLAGVGMFVSMFFLNLTREPTDAAKMRSAAWPPVWAHGWEVLRLDRNFAAFLGARWLGTFATMGFAFYIVFGLRQFAINGITAGWLTAALAVSSMLANAAMGWLGDRWGHRSMLIAGAAAATVSSLAAWAATSITWLYPAFVLSGLATVAFTTIGLAITAEFGTAETRPIYVGLAHTLTGPATILAPLLAGVIADLAGFRTMFLTAAAGGALSGVLLLRLVRDPRPHAAPTEGTGT